MKKASLFILFFVAIYSGRLLAQDTGSKLDSLLHEAYESYSYYEFDLALQLAKEAEEIASLNHDTLGLLRAQFYMECARQLKSGNAYDVSIIERYRNRFSNNGLWQEVAKAHLMLARIYSYFGDVKRELNEYLLGLEVYNKLNDEQGEAVVYSDMCLMYYDQHNYEEAFAYIRKAIGIDSKVNQGRTMHRNYNNLAIIFEHTGPIDSAIFYHKKALDFARKSNDTYSIGLSLSNLGNNYTMSGQYQLAEETLLEALKLRQKMGNYRGLAYTHNRLANLYIKKKQLAKAQFHAEQSQKNASHTSEIKIRRMALERLEEIAELRGDYRSALSYQKEAERLTDSLRNESNSIALTKMMMRYQFDREQFADSAASYADKIRLAGEYEQRLLSERNNKNIALASGLIFLLIAIGLYTRSRYIKKSKERLQKEKDRSDELLLNILPAEVAEELKEKGESEARDFEEVTVLFTDFMAFTETAQKLTAKQLVTEIDTCFKAFDEIISALGIEKIKTIGDAYMAAGGLHIPKNTVPKDVVLAALRMQAFMLQRKQERDEANLPSFKMRVGIHTGPVVAGIVGVKKFQYDIWGDTVNTASRMEGAGEVGKVNISQTTYELIKNETLFKFKSRGKIAVKGKGEIEMWFVASA